MNAQEIYNLMTDLINDGYQLEDIELKIAVGINEDSINYVDYVYQSNKYNYSSKRDINSIIHERKQLVLL